MNSEEHDIGRLSAMKSEIEYLEFKRSALIKERGQIVGRLVEKNGWKYVASLLGVSRSRIYAMRARRG